MSSKDVFQGLSHAVNDMFYRNEEMIGQVTPHASKGPTPTTAELGFALTLLLAELASSDHNFDRDEYTSIVNGLERTLDIPAAEATKLIEQAQAKLASSFRSTDEVGALLREHLSLDDRRKILEVVDQVINADGVQDGFEIYHRTRIVTILGLTQTLPKR